MPQVISNEPVPTRPKMLAVRLPVTELRSMPLPGIDDARVYTCFVRVTDIPEELGDFMQVNPRAPIRTKAGLLAGAVAKGILHTLLTKPEEFVLKNQGIYILADGLRWDRALLQMMLADKSLHGIVNGGHTFAAIREAVRHATATGQLYKLDSAFVRLTIYTGIEPQHVPEIAEGLNRSRQVDDPSLSNLQGEFDSIRQAMRGQPGETEIAYHQGDAGSVYIAEVLAILEAFNVVRYSLQKHPNALYNRQGLALQYFLQDEGTHPDFMQQLVKFTPELLALRDKVKAAIPGAALKAKFRFGRAIIGKERAKSKTSIPLPFIGQTMEHRVPNGWAYPVLAAYRANLELKEGVLGWKVPIDELLEATITSLVEVCVKEHRDNNARPDQVGKRESAYAQCYLKVQLYLAQHGL